MIGDMVMLNKCDDVCNEYHGLWGDVVEVVSNPEIKRVNGDPQPTGKTEVRHRVKFSEPLPMSHMTKSLLLEDRHFTVVQL